MHIPVCIDMRLFDNINSIDRLLYLKCDNSFARMRLLHYLQRLFILINYVVCDFLLERNKEIKTGEKQTI